MSIDHLQEANARRKAEGITYSVKTPEEKHLERDTRKTAIDCQCYNCMGKTASYRRDIRECTCGPDSSLPCPLFAWRPYK